MATNRAVTNSMFDSFAGPASELPPGKRTPSHVLAALRINPRVGTFDMSETPWLRGCIDSLKNSGHIVEDKDEPYPWHLFLVQPKDPPMTTTPTSGAADLRATFSEMLVDLPNTEPFTLFKAGFDAALAAGQATAAPARDLAAVIKGAADKLDAAVRCHPNAVDTLIHEALEILDGDREPDATRASHGQAPAGATLPDGWVPLTITHEGQHPEEVAYGPQIMMDRLGKWLGKYFAQAAQAADSVTAPAPPPECETEAEKRAFAFGWFKALESERMKADSVQEDAARYRWLREGNDAKHGAAWHVAVNLYGCEWDAAIDAAMNKGASQ